MYPADDVLRGIGRVAYNAAQLEWMRSYVLSMLDPQGRSIDVLLGLSRDRSTKALVANAAELPADDAAGLIAWAHDSHEILVRRDHVLHAYWVTTGDGADRSLYQRHRSGVEESLSAGEFELLAHAIGGISMRVLDYEAALADYLRTADPQSP